MPCESVAGEEPGKKRDAKVAWCTAYQVAYDESVRGQSRPLPQAGVDFVIAQVVEKLGHQHVVERSRAEGKHPGIGTDEDDVRA